MHLRSQYSPHSVLLFFPGGRHIGNQLLYMLDLQLYIPFEPFSNKSCDICNIKYWPHLPACTGVQVDSFYLYICTTVQVDPTYLYVLKYRLTLLPVCTGVEVYPSYLCVVVYRLSPPTCVYWCTGWPLLPVCTGVQVDPSWHWCLWPVQMLWLWLQEGPEHNYTDLTDRIRDVLTCIIGTLTFACIINLYSLVGNSTWINWIN